MGASNAEDALFTDDFGSLIYRSFTAEIVCQYCFSKSYGFFDNLEKARDVLVDLNRPGDIDFGPGLGVYHLGRFTDYYWILVSVQVLIAKVNGLLCLGSKSGGGFAEFFSVRLALLNLRLIRTSLTHSHSTPPI